MERKLLPRLYPQAFTRDQSAQIAGRTLRFSVVRAGTLQLPSGQIVVCDPLVGQEREPFVQAVPPGRYPVDLSLGFDEQEGAERIIFARILFTKKEPVVWIKALRENEANLAADEDGPFGATFSSGTAAFMDKETAVLFRIDSIDEVDEFLDMLVANYRPQRNWLNHPIDDRHNVILFSSRHGDVLSPSYFAIDETGDVCLALTSLNL